MHTGLLQGWKLKGKTEFPLLRHGESLWVPAWLKESSS